MVKGSKKKNFKTTPLNNLFEEICEKCAKRIKNRIKEKGIKQKDIYRDEYIVSRIVNNKKDDNHNKYLIPLNLIEILIEELDFKTQGEMVFGDEKEINQFIDNELFIYIIENYLMRIKDNELINEVLSRNNIFAFYNIYLNNNINPEDYFDILKFTHIHTNEDNYKFFKLIAINQLHALCKNDFIKAFKNFIHYDDNNTEYFSVIKHFCDHFDDKFINVDFMEMLKNYRTNDNPHGIAIKTIVETSVDLIKKMNWNHTNPFEYKRSIIESTAKYVLNLDYLYYRHIVTGEPEQYTPFIADLLDTYPTNNLQINNGV